MSEQEESRTEQEEEKCSACRINEREEGEKYCSQCYAVLNNYEAENEYL